MYNPYDLIELSINGSQIYGRPIELDSDIVDQNTMRNAFGSIVKPSRISTVCPDCGQGLELSVALGEPPFDTQSVSCEYCYPAPPPIADPFMSPIDDGRILAETLDPHSPKYSKPFVDELAESLNIKFEFDDIPEPPPKMVMPDVKTSKKDLKRKDSKNKKEKKIESTDEDGLT
jgi:hypothetical protein